MEIVLAVGLLLLYIAFTVLTKRVERLEDAKRKEV